MSLFGKYDPQNIFARIIRNEMPCYRVYEDEDVLAFLDLFPQAMGHTLVIPKQPTARNLLELHDDDIAILFSTARRIMAGLIAELQPDGVQLLQFNGGEGGQSVFHVHVHLVPRWPGQTLGLHGQERGDPLVLEALAERLRHRLLRQAEPGAGSGTPAGDTA